MAANLPPVDSAFVAGSLVLPQEGRAAAELVGQAGRWQASILATILGAVCIILILCLLRKIVNIIPSLFACLARGKENFNLENSRKLATDRDIIAVACIPSFCFIVSCYRLYCPSFLEGAGINKTILITTGIFLFYVLLRFIAVKIVFGKTDRERSHSAAIHCPLTFFILTTGFLIVCAGVTAISGIPTETGVKVLLWVIALIYIIFLLRETQILSSFCSLFSTFLYLCALEFLPTGILIASAVVL